MFKFVISSLGTTCLVLVIGVKNLERDFDLTNESLNEDSRSTLLLTKMTLSGEGVLTGLRFGDSFRGVLDLLESNRIIREFLNFFDDIYEIKKIYGMMLYA